MVTAAAMKLQPRPAAVLTALATLPTLDAAVSLLSLARSLRPGLTGFEVMNAFSLELVRKRFPALRQPLPPAPWTVLLEQSMPRARATAPRPWRRCSQPRWSAA